MQLTNQNPFLSNFLLDNNKPTCEIVFLPIPPSFFFCIIDNEFYVSFVCVAKIRSYQQHSQRQKKVSSDLISLCVFSVDVEKINVTWCHRDMICPFIFYMFHCSPSVQIQLSSFLSHVLFFSEIVAEIQFSLFLRFKHM